MYLPTQFNVVIITKTCNQGLHLPPQHNIYNAVMLTNSVVSHSLCIKTNDRPNLTPKSAITKVSGQAKRNVSLQNTRRRVRSPPRGAYRNKQWIQQEYHLLVQ